MHALRPVQEGLAREGRATAIEGLRGVVVVTVVGYHVLRLLLTAHGGSWGSTTTPWWWWAGTARFAVDVFFVLAGFFIVASWRSCRRRAGSFGAALRGYAVRRGRRILPLLWMTGLAFGVPLAVFGGLEWHRVALFLTTQGYLDPHLPARLDLPTWSMTTEVQFYVVAPLVAAAVRWWQGWPLLAGALALSLWWIHWDGRGDMAASLLPGRIDQFVAGAVVGELVVRGSGRSWAVRTVSRPRAGVVLMVAMVGLGIWHGATYQQDSGWWMDAMHPIGGVLIAALVLRWTTGPAPRFLSMTPWRFLGLISFGLYLWHYPIVRCGMDWLGIRGEGADPSAPVTLLVCAVLLAIALLVAMLSYVLVESRFLTLSERRKPAVGGTAPVPEPALAD